MRWWPSLQADPLLAFEHLYLINFVINPKNFRKPVDRGNSVRPFQLPENDQSQPIIKCEMMRISNLCSLKHTSKS